MNWLVEPFGYQYMLNAMWVYHTPIIKSLSDGIGNDLYNCRFVIWLWWDVRLSGNKRRSSFF
ncbi:hypothetical protein MJL48_34310, partial [Salmonella enterica subsp. enterica serovar Kentucky]|nr:hypothetical protein [Salmonella enterica subsp. enterica serovar Kentucky]